MKNQRRNRTTTGSVAKGNKGNKSQGDSRQCTRPTNDPSWYMNDEMLASTVANLNFGTRLGHTFRILDHEDGNFDFKAPGVMSIFLAPTIGYCEHATDPANVAARRIYAALTHGSGRTSQYTPADVTQVVLAYAEIVKLIQFAVRVLQTPFCINPLSKYEPDMLVHASGIDYDDLRSNLHSYIGDLQATIARANRIQMPADLTLFKKAWSLFKDIYTDTPDAMSQLYVTVPHFTWLYKEYEDKAPALEVFYLFGPSGGENGMNIMTMGDLIDIINDMIDTLYASEACLAIMADILHVVVNKGGSAFTIPQVDVNFITGGAPKLYSEEFNLQLLNASIAAPWADKPSPAHWLENFDVKQDAAKAIVISKPAFSCVVPAYEMNKILISRIGALNPAGVITATRFMISANESKVEESYNRYVTKGRVNVGDCFIAGIVMFTDPETKSPISHIDAVLSVPLSDSIKSDDIIKFMNKMAALNNFVNAPTLPMFSVAGDAASGIEFTGRGYFTDLSYYTTIGKDQLEKVHDACMLSFFDFNYGTRR